MTWNKNPKLQLETPGERWTGESSIHSVSVRPSSNISGRFWQQNTDFYTLIWVSKLKSALKAMTYALQVEFYFILREH